MALLPDRLRPVPRPVIVEGPPPPLPKTTLSRPPSNLSAFGYDYVVAVTQESINATMLEYLGTLAEDERNNPVYLCFKKQKLEKKNPKDPTKYETVRVEYEAMKEAAGGADPFTIPLDAESRTEEEETALTALFRAGFEVGIVARLGRPPHEANVPDVVTLNSHASKVTFNLLCSEFRYVQLAFDPFEMKVTFAGDGQEQHDTPWVLTADVDLRLRQVELEDPIALKGLSDDARAAVTRLDKNVYGVQQLLFNLTQARLMSWPKFSSNMSVVDDLIRVHFVNGYFAEMESKGSPILATTAYKLDQTKAKIPTPTMTLTGLDVSVSPYLDLPIPGRDLPDAAIRPKLSTLNYLCAADDHPLPPTKPFPWNWVPTEIHLQDHDGVLSINRNTLAQYFRRELYDHVAENFRRPEVKATLKNSMSLAAKFSVRFEERQTPTITMPATGPLVLKFEYGADDSDQAGLNGDAGKIKVATYYMCEVRFQGTQIAVRQEQYVNVRVEKLSHPESGNVVARILTETYDLAVNTKGQLVVERKEIPGPSMKTEIERVNGILNGIITINQVIEQITNDVRSVVGPNLKNIPISVMQDYVFPGGNVFTFKDVAFSENQDLMSYITYVQP